MAESIFYQFLIEKFIIFFGYISHFVFLQKNIFIISIELCEKIIAGTDHVVEGEQMCRPYFYAKKKDEYFKLLDGKIANIAYHLISNLSKKSF
jgi:hypothetical protein